MACSALSSPSCSRCRGGRAISARKKGQIHRAVPGRVAFAEFRGFEDWAPSRFSRPASFDRSDSRQSRDHRRLPGLAFRATAKLFLDGAKMAKIHLNAMKSRRGPVADDDAGYAAATTSTSWRRTASGLRATGAGVTRFSLRQRVSRRSNRKGPARLLRTCHTIVAKKGLRVTAYGKR